MKVKSKSMDEISKSSSKLINHGNKTTTTTARFYETAFDCKISKSNDDLDEISRINNQAILMKIHSINNCKSHKDDNILNIPSKLQKIIKSNEHLHQITTSTSTTKLTSNKITTDNKNRNYNNCIFNANIAIEPCTTTPTSTLNTTLTSAAPSTSPLPLKFPRNYQHLLLVDNHTCSSTPNLIDSKNVCDDSNNNNNNIKLNRTILNTKQNININKCNNKRAVFNTNNKTFSDSMLIKSEKLINHNQYSSQSQHHQRQQQQTQQPPQQKHQKEKPFLSTESLTVSSCGNSMDSLHSIISEGNRSTTSSESHQSTWSSHSSSDSSYKSSYPLRILAVMHSKLHILSPISDKSIQESSTPSSTTTTTTGTIVGLDTSDIKNDTDIIMPSENFKSRRRLLQNKTLLMLAEKEIQGSDSGISLQSREGSNPSSSQSATLNSRNENFTENYLVSNSGSNLNNDDIYDLPFDMPKLRRRKMEQNRCSSAITTSVVDLEAFSLDIPKFNPKQKLCKDNQRICTNNNYNDIYQTSLMQSFNDDVGAGCSGGNGNGNGDGGGSGFSENLLSKRKPNMVLNFLNNKSDPISQKKQQLKGLRLNLTSTFSNVNNNNNNIDLNIPLDKQSWFHGAISRIDAENILGTLIEGSYLLRNFKSNKNDYSLSLKCAKGFMHIKIQCNNEGKYLLGQSVQPFDSILEMIQFYCLNRLPVRGAEHMCLLEPVLAQLL